MPSKRGDRRFFEELVDRLSRLPGVVGLDANPLIGSVLIRHEGPTDAAIAQVEEGGLLRFDAAPQGRERRREPVKRPAVSKQALAAAFTGLGAVQAVRGRVTGSASENLWNAYRAQTHLGMPGVGALLAGFGLYRLVRGDLLSSGTALFFHALTLRREFEQAAGPDAGAPQAESSRWIGAAP